MIKNKEYVNLFKFFLSLLIKNKISLLFLVVSVILVFTLPFVSLLIDKNTVETNFYKYSWILITIPSLILFVGIGMFLIILFSKTKVNNVDLYINILPLNDKKTLFTRQLAIMFALSPIIIINFINFITFAIMGISLGKALTFSLICALSLSLMLIVWMGIITFITLHLKYITSIISITIFIILGVSLSIVNLMAQNYHPTNTNINIKRYKKNIVRVLSIDDTGKKNKESYAIYENVSAAENKNTNSWEPNNFIKFSPLSVFSGFSKDAASPVISWGMNKKQLINMNNNLSINYNKTKNRVFGDVINYKNLTISSVNEKSIFDYNSKINLFNDIKKYFENEQKIKANLNDSNYWKIMINELQTRNIWSKNLSPTYKEIISYIIGISSNQSLTYDIFNKYNLVKKRYLSGFFEGIKNEYNKEFADFVKYLWSDENVKLNVFSYGVFGDSKEIYKFHPNFGTYDPIKDANKYDIKYIQDILFKWNIYGGKENVQILDEKNIYRDIKYPLNNKNITSKKTFIEYIETHKTIHGLRDLLFDIQNSNPTIKMHQISFKNNVNNNLLLQNEINIVPSSKTKINFIYLILLILVSMILQAKSIKKITKGDLK